MNYHIFSATERAKNQGEKRGHNNEGEGHSYCKYEIFRLILRVLFRLKLLYIINYKKTNFI